MTVIKAPSRVYAGRDARLAVLPALRTAGLRRVGVVLDATLAGQVLVQDLLIRELGHAGLATTIVHPVQGGCVPDWDDLAACLSAFRGHSLDVLIGIGGGRTLDLAKGVAALLGNPGWQPSRTVEAIQPGVPLVLLPTTGGSGSEASREAMFVDAGHGHIDRLTGPSLGAWASVLDPALTTSCPRNATTAAGLLALAHSIESFALADGASLVRDLASTAFRKLVEFLPAAIESPHEIAAREQVLMASHFAGLTRAATGGGPATAIAAVLTARYRDLPFGLASGLALRQLVRLNQQQGFRGYALLCEGLERGRARELGRVLDVLYARLGVPSNLAEWGLMAADVPTLLTRLTATGANQLRNPKPLAPSSLAACLYGLAAEPREPRLAIAAGHHA